MSAAELAGRAAIVTGATRGIGAAVAKALARAGASVVLTGRTATDGEANAAAIRDGGGKAVFVAAEHESDSGWAQVVETAEREFGRLDILVANAGISKAAPIAQMSLAQFREMNDVNLKGCFLGLKHAVEAMRRGGRGGSVAFVSSIVGKIGVPAFSHYGASKEGVRLLAKAAALELGPEKIRVNTIHPGFVRTSMSEGFDAATLEPLIPLGRFGTPEEIASAALFLASDRSRFMTGAEIVADGGWIAR